MRELNSKMGCRLARVIEVVDVHKHFHDSKRGVVKAVDGVSFECHPGEVFGLLGANGVGKTTLLRVLSTILKPTQGSASIAGFDVVKSPTKFDAESDLCPRRLGFIRVSLRKR